jgi:AcrR family transcriptional regulator
MVVPLRERRRQLLRDEILQAARELVAENGFAATSMDDLASRVGISKPTLYSYFDTKDDLVVAAMTQLMQRLVDVIENELVDQPPLHSVLLLLRHSITLIFTEGRGAYRPVDPELMQLVSSREETRSYFQRFDTTIRDLVLQGIQQGEINPALDPDAVVLAFHGLIQATKMEVSGALGTSTTPDIETMQTTLVTLLEHGLRHPDMPPPSSST